MHVMLDLETLSTRPDAVILTMGAVKFDPHSEDLGAGIYHRVDVDEQIALGRHVDDTTVDWWGRQAADIREEALGPDNRISLENFTAELNRFLVGANCIWAQGPVFDIVILENLYRQLGKPVPWNYWQIRDSRTLFGVLGDPREKNSTDLHNALADCVSQARAVQMVFENVKSKNYLTN
jgi:3' exoribonuclease, RNase T-like